MNKLFCFDDSQCLGLAKEHGTPMFAYSAQVAEQQYQSLRTSLPDRVRIAYAVKANPHPEFLRLFAQLGAGFDCASIGELERVRALGVPPGKVLFAGPGKRRAEIQLALAMGARLNAESYEDLATANEIATKLTPVNIRIHPSFGTEDGGKIIGGSGPSAFGIDQEHLGSLIERTRSLKQIEIRGLHVFIASNQRNATNLLSIYRQVLELAHDLEKLLDQPLDLIDLGGGLGVPYSPRETDLDLQLLGTGLAELLKENPWFSGELILEPGRYLVAPAGTYLVKVVRVKLSRGHLFAILEGGVNHLLRPLLTDQPFPVRAVGREGTAVAATLAGPLCTSLDRLGTVDLPELQPGDLLAFGTAGAYGFTEGMTHFLSHPVPPEIWVP